MEYLVCLYVLIAVARFSSCGEIDESERSYHKGHINGNDGGKYAEGLTNSHRSQMGNTQLRGVALISSYGEEDNRHLKEFERNYNGGRENNGGGGRQNNDGGGRHKMTLKNAYNGGVNGGGNYREPLRYEEEGGRHSAVSENNYRGRNGNGQEGKFGNDHRTSSGNSHLLESMQGELGHGENVENSYRRGKQQKDMGSKGQYEGVGGSYGEEVYGRKKEFGRSLGEMSSNDGYGGGRGLRNENYDGKGFGSGYGGDKGFDAMYGLNGESRDGYGEGKVSEEIYKLYKEIVGDCEDSKDSSRGGYGRDNMFGSNQGSEGSYGAGDGLKGGYREGKMLETGYKGKVGSKEFENLYDVIANRHRTTRQGESERGKEKTVLIPVIKHVPIIQHVPVIEHIKVLKNINNGEGDMRRKKYELRGLSSNGHAEDFGGRGYNKMTNSGSEGGSGSNYGRSGWRMDTTRNGSGRRSGHKENLDTEGGGSPGNMNFNGEMDKTGGHFGHLFGRHVNEVW